MAVTATPEGQGRRDPPFALRPLGPALGAEILGLSLEAAMDPSVFEAVHAAFLEHQLLLFRGVDLPPATQVAFARRFGDVQVHVMRRCTVLGDRPY